MTADGAPPLDVQPKAKIFISYSRKDSAFADRLEAALKARGFEPLIDRTEIYAFEDWWQRIEALIGRADTIVFVLSPDAVASDIALKELAQGAALNKRFAPIVARSVDDTTVPEPLRRLNFVFFDNPDRFEASADQLAEALQTDIGWIRQHTEFGETARRWAANDRPGGLLLRSPVLEQAERWIGSRPGGAPAPTVETQDFLAESRRAATRRRNILSGSLAAGLAVALVLAALAYWQREKAVASEQRALVERNNVLAELATAVRLRGDTDFALRLYVHASRLAIQVEPSGTTSSISRAEFAAALLQSKWQLSLVHTDEVQSAAFSADSSRVVTASADKTARIWDARNGKQVLVLRGHEDALTSAAFSPDGARVVTASEDTTARIWDAATGTELAVLRGHLKSVRSAAFGPDGKRIVTASEDGTARVWDATSGAPLAVFRAVDTAVAGAAFSPDGSRIVTAQGDDTARIWDVTSKNEIGVLRGHRAEVNSVVFSADGSKIVTASRDATVRVWDVATANEIAVFTGHKGSVL
jgi:predicted oxidoreductase (fatty acid repression mutant protein)